MHSTDHETGEVTLSRRQLLAKPIEIDMETGEMDSNICTMPKMRKTTFIIPKELIHTPKGKKKKLNCMDTLDNYTLFKKEEVINLQEEIILGSNKTSPRLFLIPTMFISFRLFAVVIAFVEIFLHVWAHKKNAKNTDENFYYRSPLHIFTSQFCASCLDERQMDKVSKLQERRQKHWLHLKNVAGF